MFCECKEPSGRLSVYIIGLTFVKSNCEDFDGSFLKNDSYWLEIYLFLIYLFLSIRNKYEGNGGKYNFKTGNIR